MTAIAAEEIRSARIDSGCYADSVAVAVRHELGGPGPEAVAVRVAYEVLIAAGFGLG